MFPSQRNILNHILDECSYILKVTDSITKTDMLNDETLTRAIVRSLEIIGEATRRLDPDFRRLYPDVEWKKMAATRDVLIHNYFGIDYDIVWSMVIEKIPNLECFLKEIIKDLE